VKLVDRAAVERLNDLLEMERVAAASVSGLITLATTPAMGKLLDKLRDDEAWSCAGLTRVIKHLGGKPSHDTGALARKAQVRPSLRERLDLLNRGQTWVLKRLDRLLEEDLDRETEGFPASDAVAPCGEHPPVRRDDRDARHVWGGSRRAVR
jgi:nitronate monooxygenase